MPNLAIRNDAIERLATRGTDRRDFLLVSERLDQSADLVDVLRTAGEVSRVSIADLQHHAAGYFRLFIDIDLTDVESVRRLRQALDQPGLRWTPRYFVTAADHHTKTQALALNAAITLSRPFKSEHILAALRQDSSVAFKARLDAEFTPVCQGIAAAHDVLVQIFDGLPAGRALSLNDVLAQETDIIQALQGSGLKPWLDVVDDHHNSSYRHCLSVTGFAVAFAQHLRFNLDDQRRLARSALLHDVGKAFIPVGILDKPGKLTPEEMSLMREHARLGFEALRVQGGFSEEALDVVLNHHELLDGTGYPSGLRAADISDPVRMVTIADIFSALVEERAYRGGMSAGAAYAILVKMGPKLDQDLVAAFRPVALGSSRH